MAGEWSDNKGPEVRDRQWTVNGRWPGPVKESDGTDESVEGGKGGRSG